MTNKFVPYNAAREAFDFVFDSQFTFRWDDLLLANKLYGRFRDEDTLRLIAMKSHFPYVKHSKDYLYRFDDYNEDLTIGIALPGERPITYTDISIKVDDVKEIIEMRYNTQMKYVNEYLAEKAFEK